MSARPVRLLFVEKRQQRAVFVMIVAAILVAAWACSLLWPSHFGSCSTVPLRFGPNPSVRDCHAYAPQDFAVPIVLLIVVGLLVGDADFDVEGLGMHFSRRKRATQVGKRAVAEIEAKESDLDRRRDEFFQSIEQSARTGNQPGPEAPEDAGA